jgi:tRNA(Leu) C34 or U34 (ribose-2'-O)-methylase TrmL
MFAVALNNCKNPINLGHVMRAAHAYGASMIVTTGNRVKSATDVSSAYNYIPVIRTDDLHSVIPFGFVPVAVELHAKAVDLRTFEHPKNAFYVFGAEDQTLGEKVLSWCKHVVYVPTKICMNLSACANVVMYDRIAKGES